MKWRFSFCDIFFVPEIFEFSYYANLVTDDVIGCENTVVWHKIKNISANKAMLLWSLQECSTLWNVSDGTHFDVAMTKCSVPVSCFFKMKYHQWALCSWGHVTTIFLKIFYIMGYNLTNARNGKSISKIPKWQSLRSLAWDFMMVWISKKNKKICMEIVAGEQGLALQQLFPYKSS